MNKDGFKNLDLVLGDTGMARPIPEGDEHVEYVTVSGRVISDSGGDISLPFDSQAVLNKLAELGMIAEPESRFKRIARMLITGKHPEHCPILDVVSMHPDEILFRDTNIPH